MSFFASIGVLGLLIGTAGIVGGGLTTHRCGEEVKVGPIIAVLVAMLLILVSILGISNFGG